MFPGPLEGWVVGNAFENTPSIFSRQKNTRTQRNSNANKISEEGSGAALLKKDLAHDSVESYVYSMNKDIKHSVVDPAHEPLPGSRLT